MRKHKMFTKPTPRDLCNYKVPTLQMPMTAGVKLLQGRRQLKRYSNLAHQARWACGNHILIMLRSPYNGGHVILIKSVLNKEIARSETVAPFVSTVLLNTRCIARAVLTYIFLDL